MEQTVYLDLFFIINFSMDFLCFFLTSALLSQRFLFRRCIVASVIGGVYSCISLFTSLKGLWGILADMSACLLMSTVAVKKRGNLKGVGIYTLVYTATSIVLGGAMTALFSLFNRLGLDRLLGSGEDSDGISVWLFAILALVGAVISFFSGSFFKKRSSRKVGEVELTLENRKIVLKAICDSGNLLTDPISLSPCIVAEQSEVERILPSGFAAMTRGISAEVSGAYASRLRIIPTQTVNGNGILYAVRMDRIRIDMGKGFFDVNALVALGNVDKNADGAKALIPSTLAFGVP